jgi:hypothetical protein
MLIRLSRTTILGLVLAVSAAVLVAGCGGSGKNADGARIDPAAAEAAIRASWETFFDGASTAQTRISLLEDGDEFAKEITTVSASPLAKQAKASVTSVDLDEPTSATVTFSLLLGETPVLEGIEGTAVLVDGTWKVGKASFCQLAALQGAAPGSCPAAE